MQPLPDRWITVEEVERITGRKRSTLNKDRLYKRGIPFCKLGNKSVRYRLTDVLRFMDSLPLHGKGEF